MPAEHPLVGGAWPTRADAPARDGAQRRIIGQVAGLLTIASALVGFVAARLLMTNHHVGHGFDISIALGFASGLAFLLIPWDRIDRRWLNAIPILVTVQLAFGIRLGGFYGDIASDYYVFVGAFAAYAFTSRWVVAGHVALACAAAALILVYHHRAGTPTAAGVTVVTLLIVGVAAIVTALREGLEKRQRELQDLTLRDPLTGVGNYRLLAERLDYELTRHRRSGQALTVLLLDMNGFKQVNDTYGHLAGDQMLVDVAEALGSALRSQDTLARQGGDEFSILAPETNSEQAEHLMRRVHAAMEARLGSTLTASAGWATFPDDGTDADALLNLADADLRRAKRSRREPRPRGLSPQPPPLPVGEPD